MKIERQIMSLLIHGKKTATELSISLGNEYSRCPDDLARVLNQMRKKGLIHGEFSNERSTWVFWVISKED
jgi:hypothetical protein